MTAKISIIVPVYNVERYLRRCLDSLVKQTFEDIEIVLINDCSQQQGDDRICREYAEKDERVRYLRHTENRGLGGARNTGLKAAVGEYLWFVDSDDFVDVNACELLYKTACNKEADIIAFSATSHFDGLLDLGGYETYQYIRDETLLNRVLRGSEFVEQALNVGSFHVSACIHLFSRSILQGRHFREKVYHEDTDFVPLALYSAERIFCTKYAPYYRLIRTGSITQQAMTEKQIQDKFSYVAALIDYIKGHCIDAPDVLIDFAERQFNYVWWQYREAAMESSDLERGFSNLQSLYERVIAGRARPIEVMDCRSVRQRYGELTRELEQFQQSLGGQLRKAYWAMAGYFGRKG